MPVIPFELSNEQRKYLGLIPVESHWEGAELFGSYVYFDGDVIRKKIIAKDGSYYHLERKTSSFRWRMKATGSSRHATCVVV